jgi:hypothetical protein
MISSFTYSPDKKTGQRYTFANINGKMYQILRGYKLNYNEIWLQIAGKTALHKSDLGKQWEIFGSKGLYIAYINRYLNYQSTRQDLQLTFVGNTAAGSRFMALWFISQRYGLGCSQKQLSGLAQPENPAWDNYHFGASYLEDLTSDSPDRKALHIDFQLLDYEERATEFIEEITNGGEK